MTTEEKKGGTGSFGTAVLAVCPHCHSQHIVGQSCPTFVSNPPETTEEKKCEVCRNPNIKIGVHTCGCECPGMRNGKHFWAYTYLRQCVRCGDFEELKAPLPHQDMAPPETGREWEVDMKIKIDDILTNILINTRKNKGNVDNVVYEKAVNKLVSLIRSIASSALAQGEKIGGEKERRRISSATFMPLFPRFPVDWKKQYELLEKKIKDALKG